MQFCLTTYKFIGWGNSPFYQNFINKNGRKPQCADYAREQLRVVGVLVGGGSDPTNMYVYSEKKVQIRLF